MHLPENPDILTTPYTLLTLHCSSALQGPRSRGNALPWKTSDCLFLELLKIRGARGTLASPLDQLICTFDNLSDVWRLEA